MLLDFVYPVCLWNSAAWDCTFILLFLLHRIQEGLTGVTIHAEQNSTWMISNTQLFGKCRHCFQQNSTWCALCWRALLFLFSLIIYRKSGCTKEEISTGIISLLNLNLDYNSYFEVLELSLQYMNFKGLVPSLLYLASSQIVFYYWFCVVFSD